MKKRVFLVVMTVLLVLAGSAFALTDEEYRTVQKVANEYMSNTPPDGYHIMAEDVLKRIQAGDKNLVIVDVRMPKDKKYDQGHMPGAIYIGFKEIAKPENLGKLPKDKDIIVLCDTGHEQNKVLSVLRMLGYKAYDMKWGMMSWKTLPPTGLTLKAIEGSILNTYPVEK
ncbi:MAG: rhodanese-like domain-containing protein [Nitrospiraceae bacterium]|nr:MAG: rhodanese-like domain-containing protein [Nitrospiraceae bacterium]